jgi:dethiobiotin synthetase
MTAVFVTGTDTGVGKTRVSTALLRAYAKQHARCVGMKPVAAGCDWIDGEWLNEDVAALRDASSLKVPSSFDNPYALPDPVSPHIAAKLADERIELSHIEASFHALRQHADVVVVEGAGGFIVPFQDDAHEWVTSADLAMRLHIPMVLVVGIRLGCLNHALLSQEAILSRGLKLAGWVANVVDADMAQQDANMATLQRRMQAPMLAHWGFQPSASPFDLADSLTLPV